MEIFNNDNYKFISDYVEQKLPILKENQNFKAEYLRLTDAMEELVRCKIWRRLEKDIKKNL